MRSCETKPNQKKVARSVVGGVIGGLAAAYAMNQFQVFMTKTARKVGVTASVTGGGAEAAEDATVKTAKAISSSLFQHDLTVTEKKWAGPLVHYVTGATFGGIYGLLSANLPAVKFGGGTLYGTAVWFGADGLAVPALGLAPPAAETPIATHVQALAAHMVFGFVANTVKRLVSWT